MWKKYDRKLNKTSKQDLDMAIWKWKLCKFSDSAIKYFLKRQSKQNKEKNVLQTRNLDLLYSLSDW